ncbi:hypothetical protein ACIHDR_22160 [Nocardia sp. NPDC052278]|uniref:hypothetical protein n=1 Tax=unclassified Nocardia TaxID=2637762 RepID=UPI0036B06DF3
MAEAAVLDGRPATWRWPACGERAAHYPGIDVDADAICVRDGPIVTSAGVAAGINMALALAADHGAELARALAEHPVSTNQEARPDQELTHARFAPNCPRGRIYAAVVRKTGCGTTGFIVIDVGSCRTESVAHEQGCTISASPK